MFINIKKLHTGDFRCGDAWVTRKILEFPANCSIIRKITVLCIFLWSTFADGLQITVLAVLFDILKCPFCRVGMPTNPSAKGASADQATTTNSDHAVLTAIATLRTDITSDLATLKNNICTSVDAKIDTLTTSLRAEIALARTEIHGDIAAARAEAGAGNTELETGTNQWADVTTSLENKLQILTKQVTSLTEKCEDLEGRSRRNNLRIIGLSEGIEGTRPTDFIADLLEDALQLQQRPLLNRAHRFLQPRPKPGERSRPFIIWVHYFRAKENIMQRARQAGPLLYNGQQCMLFPDYTAAVAKKRSAFDEVKKLLRDRPEVKYGLLFPARFRITHNGTQSVFNTPEEATAFVQCNILV